MRSAQSQSPAHGKGQYSGTVTLTLTEPASCVGRPDSCRISGTARDSGESQGRLAPVLCMHIAVPDWYGVPRFPQSGIAKAVTPWVASCQMDMVFPDSID